MLKHDDRVTFNINKNTGNVLEELNILLAPDQQHKKAFAGIPRTGFKNSKNLKSHLVRSVLPNVEVSDNSVVGKAFMRWEKAPCELLSS